MINQRLRISDTRYEAEGPEYLVKDKPGGYMTSMNIGISLFLITVGAILTFATTWKVYGDRRPSR